MAAGPEVLHAAVGTELNVEAVVDAGHRVPYAVGLDGLPILDEVVSASVTVELTAGRHSLTWRFNHALESGWSHELTATLGGGDPIVLDKKSAAKGDPVNSRGGIDLEVP
jgi:hypothetical protein